MTQDERLERIERLCERQELRSLEIIDQIKGNERRNIVGIEPALKKLSQDVFTLNEEKIARKVRNEHTASIFKWSSILLGVIGGITTLIITVLKFIL